MWGRGGNPWRKGLGEGIDPEEEGGSRWRVERDGRGSYEECIVRIRMA